MATKRDLELRVEELEAQIEEKNDALLQVLEDNQKSNRILNALSRRMEIAQDIISLDMDELIN